MVPVPLSRLEASRAEEIEAWPYLDEGVLLIKTRSRKVCMTCHSFATTPASTASPCSPAICIRV